MVVLTFAAVLAFSWVNRIISDSQTSMKSNAKPNVAAVLVMHPAVAAIEVPDTDAGPRI
jgi:hypothetical protein